MKKSIKLTLIAAMALGTTSVYATNGSNLIGTGAKSRGMGGTSIGVFHGAESGLSNPALITSVEGTEVSFGGTLFMPDVENANGSTTFASSDADMNVIPEVSIASKVNDSFSWGIGMWGTAGMGVDYRDAANVAQKQMVTNLQLMQFGVALAYKMDNFSVAITPVLQYGSLDINYDINGTAPGGQVGAGVAQDLKFGYNLGVAYKMDDITLGATYKSQIDMEYDGVLSSAVGAMTGGAYTNDKLSTPAEYGLGVSYKLGQHLVALDYQRVKWSDADGYKDFEWDDQDVYSIGYQYSTDKWALRAGYNHATSPITEQSFAATNGAGLGGGLVNTFNLLGFPGMVESHYTLGGTYNVSKKTSVDVAYTYAADNTETFKNFMNQDITTSHSQTGLSAQLNYKF